MSGSAKKKGPYANSLSESKVKQLSMDLKGGKDGLSDEEFKKKYGKTKQEVRKELQNKPVKQEPVSEARLEEEDIILVPGQGRKMKTGFVPHGKSRVDHEVEMAKSDLLQLLKNTQTVMMCIKDKSEDEGLEGWVQEKIIKSADYMNTIAEYLEGKRIKEEIKTGGVIAGGGVGEGKKVDRMVKHITKSEKNLGHSKKEAENIAWATANKRGMLDNKNKKAK
jgi:hypothetical protein